jgi:hypothetical protein
MFAPSQLDVRRFFCAAHAKQRAGDVLTPIETLAAHWINAHPEYAAELSDEAAALAAVYTVEQGRTNPFLHLSMHLTLSEQVSIDQPRGVKQAFELLCGRLGSAHQAHHQMMECLGAMIWTSQRGAAPPDAQAYVECLRRRATAP